jgi:hypothetical protein
MRADEDIVGLDFNSGSRFVAEGDRAALKRGSENQIFVVHPNSALLGESELHLTGAKVQSSFFLGFHAIAVKDRGANGGIAGVQTRVRGLQDDARLRSLRGKRNAWKKAG